MGGLLLYAASSVVRAIPRYSFAMIDEVYRHIAARRDSDYALQVTSGTSRNAFRSPADQIWEMLRK